jgi:FAD/FMN-containing dehydrogenase
MPESWRNWSGDLRCSPAIIETPADEASVLRLVRSARQQHRTVRVVGSGHSSMPIATTDDGVLVSLGRLQGLVSIDSDGATATIWAGSKIWSLGDPLLERGYSMVTMGDIDRQALAGALGTATHGTGRDLGNISSSLVAARIVTGTGEVVDVSAASDPDAFRAVRVSLGALGILTRATIRVLPAYRLHERVERVPIAECIGSLDERIATNRHFEFFWYPKVDLAEMKTLNITDAEPASASGIEGERIGWSPHIIPSVRENRFHEMEYAIPAEHGPECFDRVRERMLSRHPDVVWPIEYRTVSADDAYLSPHYGRATVTISVHEDARKPYRDFFGDIEPIFWDYDGRPHWGKINTLDRERLRERYPCWDDFVAVRKRFDPDGVFLNPYLRELFA